MARWKTERDISKALISIQNLADTKALNIFFPAAVNFLT